MRNLPWASKHKTGWLGINIDEWIDKKLSRNMDYFKSEFRIEMNAIFFVSQAASFTELFQDVSQGLVGRLISANPGLNLIQASLSFLQRIYSDIFLYSF